MAPREDMLDSLDSLKMLASDGAFANKEGNAGTKVAPMPNVTPGPHTNAAQQALQTHEEKLRAFKAELDAFKARLNEQDERQQKKKLELDKRENSLVQRNSWLETRERVNRDNLEKERVKNEKENDRVLDGQRRLRNEENVLWHKNQEATELLKKYQIALQRVRSQESELQAKIDKVQELKEQLEREQDSLERKQNSLDQEKEKVKQSVVELEQEKEKVKQSEKKCEDLTKTVDLMKDAGRGATLAALKIFVRMWKDELLTLKRPDKLRCIIPHDTTTWFNAAYYRLDETRKSHFIYELGERIDLDYKDLRVDINTAAARFVIFYRQSKLIEYANEKWGGDLDRALFEMHHTQEDDMDKVDENIKLTER